MTGARAEDGFTIIETLVAIALFSLLIVAVIYPITNSYKLTAQSKNNLRATGDAQSTLEKARQIVITNYNDSAKIAALLAAPEFSKVTCENVNLYNQVIAGREPCATAGFTPPVRRLTIKDRTIGSTKDDIQFSIGVTAQ